ncbi:MAG: hypothetical protein SH817_15130 [Leptospira sp.]|nr:hypothetical protein [Leptospira sp.]
MTLGFIESQPRRRPNRPNPNFSNKLMLVYGLIMIFGFTIALLPFGAYLPVSISIWALMVLFLPLLLIGISFISKFGYYILISVFLSLFCGGISILFLGDFVGYITQVTAIKNMIPEEVVKHSHYKYIFLKDFILNEDKGGSFLAPIAVRARGQSKYYGPVLKFRFVPILSSVSPNKNFELYALCYAKPEENCDFVNEARGGSVLRESIWDSEKRNVVGDIPKENAIFLVWRAGGEEEIQKKGVYSLGFILFVAILWSYLALYRKVEGLY